MNTSAKTAKGRAIMRRAGKPIGPPDKLSQPKDMGGMPSVSESEPDPGDKSEPTERDEGESVTPLKKSAKDTGY